MNCCGFVIRVWVRVINISHSLCLVVLILVVLIGVYRVRVTVRVWVSARLRVRVRVRVRLRVRVGSAMLHRHAFAEWPRTKSCRKEWALSPWLRPIWDNVLELLWWKIILMTNVMYKMCSTLWCYTEYPRILTSSHTQTHTHTQTCLISSQTWTSTLHRR